MDKNLEQKMAELVADLSPADYEKWAPGLQEMGLALAEARQAKSEAERLRGVLERTWEAYAGVLEDLDRSEERMDDAMRLIQEAAEER